MVVPDFVRFYSMKTGNFPILQQKIYTGPKAAIAVKGFIHRTSVYYIGGFVAFAVIPTFRMLFKSEFFDKIFAGIQNKTSF